MRLSNVTRGRDMGEVKRADTYMKRLAGLLFADPGRAPEPLWIVPCWSIHTVGMRHALDVVFLSRDMKVVKIAAGVKPFRLGPCCPGAYSVVEFFPGRLDVQSLAVGDQLALN